MLQLYSCTAVKVFSAALAGRIISYQSARATTRTHNSFSGKCLPYDVYTTTTNDIQTAVDIIKCGARSGSPQIEAIARPRGHRTPGSFLPHMWRPPCPN